MMEKESKQTETNKGNFVCSLSIAYTSEGSAVSVLTQKHTKCGLAGNRGNNQYINTMEPYV